MSEQQVLSFSVEKVNNGYLYLVTNVDGTKQVYVKQVSSEPDLVHLRDRLVVPPEVEEPSVDEEVEPVPTPVKVSSSTDPGVVIV